MGAEVYKSDCRGCKMSQRTEEYRGGTIELDGNWILNHYDGDEGFLGWMALQPRFHRMELTDLSTNEVKALGGNIQNIDIALRQYWSIRFKTDPIQRVYVVYFFESVYDEPPTEFHLHIHLIPRPKSLGQLLRECHKLEAGSVDERIPSRINAWKIYKLSKCQNFPQHYRKDNQEVEALMTYLRGQLWKSSGR